MGNSKTEITFLNSYSDINKEEWHQFVKTHPNGNIFQTPHYFRVCEKSKTRQPLVVAAKRNDSIIGIMMGVVEKENMVLFSSLTARTIVWGGPLLKANEENIRKQLIKEFNELASKKSIYCQIRNLREYNADEKLSFEKSGFEYVDHFGITVDLKPDIETLWSALKSDGRGSVRKAEKENLKFRKIDDKKHFFEILEILQSLYEYLGLPLPEEEYFSALYDELVPEGYLKVFGVFFEGNIIAGSIEICYNNMIFDFYKCASSEHLKKCPNDIMYWEIIKHGKKNNYDVFNMGGAGKPGEEYGVRDHKLKFGSKLHHHGRFLNVYKPFLYKFGKFGLNYWDQVKKYIEN